MPKIIGQNLEEHRQLTRDALFGALSRLMAERGFDAITMASLATEAGIGRTAIYNYYADKEELLMAFVASEMSHYLDTINSSLSETDNPLVQLRIYIRTQLLTDRAYLAAPGPPLQDTISKETAHELAKHIRETSKILVLILERCVAASIIPDQNLAVSVHLVHGTLTGRRVPHQEPQRTAFFEQTERFVLGALGVSPQMICDMPSLGAVPAPHCTPTR
ncbi:MAG: TetR/AcrR family transcriptional regulator [Trueperella sp.]|nr:TetR/AcrR family transcriptional regulator [Trueperella sp.]